MKPLLIRDMAEVERPRERLAAQGVEALKSEELLALVLRTGYHGRGVLELSRDLLTAFSLPQLFAMPLGALSKIKGLGPARAATLLAAAELARRADHASESALPVMRSAGDIAAQSMDIVDKKKEYLVAFFLNARHQLIAKEIISIGTLTASLAHPREIFSPAIGKAAAGVILVHNHPSGDPSPSEEDVRLTRRIADAGRLMGIDLLDHVIVARRGTYSFKSAGQPL